MDITYQENERDGSGHLVDGRPVGHPPRLLLAPAFDGDDRAQAESCLLTGISGSIRLIERLINQGYFFRGFL